MIFSIPVISFSRWVIIPTLAMTACLFREERPYLRIGKLLDILAFCLKCKAPGP
jgi:hypothetical protein